MRSKSNNLFMRITALSMLDILYFLWQPYPKSILLRTVCESGGRSDLITTIIFFIIQFFVLRKVFLNEHAKERRRFAFRGVAAFFAIICVQLMCDAALISTYDQQYFLFPIVCNVCSIAQWVLIFLIMTWAYPDERRQWSKNRAKWCIIAIVLVFLVAAMVIVFEQKHMSYLFEKYTATSWQLGEHIKNVRYRQGLFNFLMSITTAISLCTALYFSRNKKKADDRPIAHHIGKVAVRVFLIISIVGLLYFAKLLIVPQSIITFYSAEHSDSHTTPPVYEDSTLSKYKITYRTTDAFRFFENSNDAVSVFSRTDCVISYCDEHLYTFKYDGYYPSSGVGPGNTGYLNDYSAAIFAKTNLVWEDNGHAHHIDIQNINTQGEDEQLIKICKRMIEGVNQSTYDYLDFQTMEISECAGDWDFFEYTAGYLLKYDPDFIIPYIERYAEGKFTDDELKGNSTIRPEFIQAIAQNLLAQIEK